MDNSRLLIGAAVAREFGQQGRHGIHYGRITGFQVASGVTTYTITYDDGDTEELSAADTFSLMLLHDNHPPSHPEAWSQEPGARSQEPSSPPGARSHQEPATSPPPSPTFHIETESDDEQEEPALDDLPPPVEVNSSPFTWGTLEGGEFTMIVDEIYEIVVYWRKNLFLVPNGPQGRAFLAEKTKLFQALAAAGPLERIAFKALAIMDHLLLQKPHYKSTSKVHVLSLEKRLQWWRSGDLRALYKEAATLQERLGMFQQKKQHALAKTFANLMITDRVHSAMRLLRQEDGSAGPLELTDNVFNTLRKLQYPRSGSKKGRLDIGEEPEPPEPVIFDAITAETIAKAAAKVKGAHGPSGGDAENWKRQLCSFGPASVSMCDSIAAVTRRLCTTFLDPSITAALLANRLLPFNKPPKQKPRVPRVPGAPESPESPEAPDVDPNEPVKPPEPDCRPIGVGEVLRRIIGKAVVAVLRKDIVQSIGTINLCAGQKAGPETIIHLMNDLLQEDDCEGLLLVDGTSAFQLLNRLTTLHNARHLCAPVSIILINFYRGSARLFVQGGRELASDEGTTQGCNFAMIMYALGIIPLIRCVHYLLKSLDEEEEPCSPPNGTPLRPEPEAESSSQVFSQSSLGSLSLSLSAAEESEPGARSQEPATSQEPGDRSQEPGARSQEPPRSHSLIDPSMFATLLSGSKLKALKEQLSQLRSPSPRSHPRSPQSPQSPQSPPSPSLRSHPRSPQSPQSPQGPQSPQNPPGASHPHTHRFTQGWYADDGQAAGKIWYLRHFWDFLLLCGPSFGYFPKAKGTVLIVKPEDEEHARGMFEGTGICITPEGHRDLGAAVGTTAFVNRYTSTMVAKWVAEVRCLTNIAHTQPHAAFAAFNFGLKHKWTYYQRTTDCDPEDFQPLENIIRDEFIPAIFNANPSSFSPSERALFSLPASEFGGLGLTNPVKDCRENLKDSRRYTLDLRRDIYQGNLDLPAVDYRAISVKNEDLKKTRHNKLVDAICSAEPRLKRVIQFAREKGASNIWTTLPNEKFGLLFGAKEDFWDALALRYHRPINNLQPTCACGETYSLDHSQICKTGGFIHMRHDDPVTLLAQEAKKVFNDVQVEPSLAPLTGEDLEARSANRADNARSDLVIRSFYRPQRRAFFDLKVFYPFARSYLSKSPEQLYRTFANAKKNEYEQRIRDVEDGDFSPLIMSSSGGMGPEMQIMVKHLCRKIAAKQKVSYDKVIGVLRCKLAFQMMHSAIVCLRGSRSIRRSHSVRDPMLELDIAASDLRI